MRSPLEAVDRVPRYYSDSNRSHKIEHDYTCAQMRLVIGRNSVDNNQEYGRLPGGPCLVLARVFGQWLALALPCINQRYVGVSSISPYIIGEENAWYNYAAVGY